MTPTDILGNIKLYNADNMEVMKTFKDKQFDLAIAENNMILPLPYRNMFVSLCNINLKRNRYD
jgi:hypothetical protein